jgi:hypothetical protein
MRQYHDVHTARSTLRAKQKPPSQQRELDVVCSVSESGSGRASSRVLTRVAYGHPLSLSLSLSPSACLSLCMHVSLSLLLFLRVYADPGRERRTVHYHAAAYISPRQLPCRKSGFSILLREESGR